MGILGPRPTRDGKPPARLRRWMGDHAPALRGNVEDDIADRARDGVPAEFPASGPLQCGLGTSWTGDPFVREASGETRRRSLGFPFARPHHSTAPKRVLLR